MQEEEEDQMDGTSKDLRKELEHRRSKLVEAVEIGKDVRKEFVQAAGWREGGRSKLLRGV